MQRHVQHRRDLPYQLGFDYNLSAGHLSTPPNVSPTVCLFYAFTSFRLKAGLVTSVFRDTRGDRE